MKVVFDHQIFSLQAFGGISRYVARLNEHLQMQGHDAKILAPLHINRHLNESTGRVGIRVPCLPPEAAPFLSAANRMLVRLQGRALQPDIVHETYYTDLSMRLGAAAVVVTVHDMIHERLSGCFSRRDGTTRRKMSAVLRADHVIAISQATKNDLCELFDISPEKVSVVYHGFDELPPSDRTVIAAGGRPFLLYVGQRRGYKNFEALLRAIGLCPILRSTHDVVAFGGPGLSTEELRKAEVFGIRPDGLRHLGGDDSVLAACYRSAAAFIYPSLYEGFGLPPLEAMSCECPVLSSNTSSLPEVIGDAAEFFDPNDTESMAHAIKYVLSDADRRRQLVQAGLRRLRKFSWNKCAGQTVAAYERALSQ
jgi:glycosyltransferase involved in cell wall biosynthesis